MLEEQLKDAKGNLLSQTITFASFANNHLTFVKFVNCTPDFVFYNDRTDGGAVA